MLKRFSFLIFSAALTFALLAVPAFTQTNSQTPDWDPTVVLHATTDWIGNTYAGNDPTPFKNTHLHVPLDMDAIYVTPNGNVYTNTTWDEGERPLSVFNRNGQLISQMNYTNSNGPQTDYGQGGGAAVAAAGDYIFQSFAPGGTGITIVDQHTWLRTPYTVNGSSTLNSSQGIFGLAVAKNKLYVTEQDENLVEVFDISDIANINLISSFSVPGPVRIAVDQAGGFWVSHKDNTSYPFTIALGGQGLNYVDHYDSKGDYVHTITLPEGSEVGALAISSWGALLVADDGPDQNIKIYANLQGTPIQAGTFGEKGGSLAGPIPGRTGPLSPLRFRGITGIGTDAQGNIYVSQSGYGFDTGVGHGVDLQSYTWYGALNWERDGLGFRSLGAIDPHSEADFYDAYHHYKIDYSQSGRVDTYVADTYNQFKYPEDIRASSIMSQGEIKYIRGRKFLLSRPPIETSLEIYRYEGASEIPIPCVAFDYGSWQGTGQDFVVQPLDGEFIWRDVNGDGQMTNAAGLWDPAEFFEPTTEGTWQGNPIPNEHRDGANFYMDDNGDVWQQNYGTNTPPYEPSIHLRRYYFQGFDSHGSPIYDFNHMAIYNVGLGQDIPDTTDVSQVVFEPKASKGGTLFVMGSSNTQLVRYDHWDTTSTANRKATWSILLTTNGDITNYWNGETFTKTGDFIFVDFNSGNADNNGDWGNHYNQVYSAKTGAYVGRLVAGNNVGGMYNIGDTDESHSLSSFKRDNGEYVIIREEDWQAKFLMFRWTPPDPLPAPTAPYPTGVSGVPDDMAFTLNWTLDPKALAYTISSGPTITGPFVPQSSGIYGTNTFSVLGLTNGVNSGYAQLTVFYPNGASANSQPLPISAVAQGTSYGGLDPTIVFNNDQTYGCTPLCYEGVTIGHLVQGASVTWSDVVVPTSGTYNVRIYDENGQNLSSWGGAYPTINLTANGTATVTSPPMPQTDNGCWCTPGYVTTQLPLNAGTNTIELWVPADAATGDPNIDRILVGFNPVSQ